MPSTRDETSSKDGTPPQFIEDSPLLRQVFYEGYFRFFGILMVLAAIVVLSVLPKWFLSTPKGVSPVYKMSGLDWLQAKMLALSAEGLITKGMHDTAVLTLKAAIANNPGDPSLSLRLVETALSAPGENRNLRLPAISQSLWLLRLLNTNDTSVELAARVFERHGLDEYSTALLMPRSANLTLPQAGQLLRALFNRGQMDRFGEVWSTYEPKLTSNPEMQVFAAAWQAGWGPPGTVSKGKEAMARALESKETQLLATRLNLRIAETHSLPRDYERGLALLVDHHADRVADHLGYWRLLIQTGRTTEAANLAEQFSHPPESATDALQLAELCLQLGKRRLAYETLERHLPSFSYRPDYWYALSELIIGLERWFELRELAVNMRQSDFLRGDLTGYSWFLEGLSELNNGRPDRAVDAFSRIAENSSTDPLLVFRASTRLTSLGFPMIAAQCLESVQQNYREAGFYWQAVVGAAYEARDFGLMRSAAANGYELLPDEPVFINNYAALLLMERTNQPLAIQLTLTMLNKAPNSIAAKLNHAFALVQSSRWDDAQQLIKSIDTNRLDARYTTMLHLTCFDMHSAIGDWEAASVSKRAIERRFLFTPQTRWLEDRWLKRPPSIEE